MARVYDYSGLTDLIVDYTQRKDEKFIKNIPSFIFLAERRITSECKLLELKKTAFLIPNEVFYFKKPTDWRSTQEIYFTIDGEKILLQPRNKEFVDSVPDKKNTLPKYYCELSNLYMQIAPLDDNLFARKLRFFITYYSVLEPLSDLNKTNIISQNFPELLLYGALMETASYLGDDDRLPTWKQYYQEAKQSAMNEDLLRVINSIPNNH